MVCGEPNPPLPGDRVKGPTARGTATFTPDPDGTAYAEVSFEGTCQGKPVNLEPRTCNLQFYSAVTAETLVDLVVVCFSVDEIECSPADAQSPIIKRVFSFEEYSGPSPSKEAEVAVRWVY